MDVNTFLQLPTESMDCETLAPPYPFRSNVSGYLYCGWCLHDIRLVSRTKTGVSCADCGQNLDIAASSFIQENA